MTFALIRPLTPRRWLRGAALALPLLCSPALPTPATAAPSAAQVAQNQAAWEKATTPAAPASDIASAIAAATLSPGGGLVVLLISLAAYFLPWIIAGTRHHHQLGAIALTNVLLGWTVLGWVAALIWSATAVREVQT